MKYLTTLLLLISFNVHALEGIDTSLTERTNEAAQVRVTVKSDTTKVHTKVGDHELMWAREAIRNAVSISTLERPNSMAHSIAVALYYRGVLVDTVRLESRFDDETFKIELSPNLIVTPVDIP